MDKINCISYHCDDCNLTEYVYPDEGSSFISNPPKACVNCGYQAVITYHKEDKNNDV